MQGALNASPVVVAELTQAVYGALQVLGVHFLSTEGSVATDEPGFRLPPQVQHHFQQLFQVFPLPQSRGYPHRQHVQHQLQLFPHCVMHRRQYHSSAYPSFPRLPGIQASCVCQST